MRTARGAVTYNDFESFASLSDWAHIGGTSFSLVPGHKGNALRYSDNNNGIGGASQVIYYHDLSSYASLWVSVKVYGSPTNTYNGLALINNNLSRLYEVSLYNGSIGVLSWNVETGNGWRQLGSTSIANYNANYWYTIVLNYAVTSTAVNFYVWVYDPNGNQVAYTTASSTSGNKSTPAYIGLEVDYTGTTGTGYGVFDDFIISTTDPRYVHFGNLQSGMVFNVYDSFGALTYNFTATSSSYTLSVIPDVVLGNSTGGYILVLYPGGSFLCLNVSIPSTDAFLGGDSYSLTTMPLTWSISSTGTSASVYAYVSSNPYQLTSFPAIALTLNQSYYMQLRNATDNSNLTDWYYFGAGDTVYVILERYRPAGSNSTEVLNIVACTNGRLDVDPAPGACVFYPLNIILTAG